LTVDWLIQLRENYCSDPAEFALLLRGAGVSFADLYHEHGLCTCAQLRKLGYDALDLLPESSCQELLELFKHDDIYRHFVECAGDAVCISATKSGDLLGLTLEKALRLCAAQPRQASAVLEAHFRVFCIHEDAGDCCAFGAIRRASPIAGCCVETLLATHLSTTGGLPGVTLWRPDWWHDVQGEIGSPELRALGGPSFSIRN